MGTEPLERKLAGILYADVAGYSRLTGEDEDATHRSSGLSSGGSVDNSQFASLNIRSWPKADIQRIL